MEPTIDEKTQKKERRAKEPLIDRVATHLYEKQEAFIGKAADTVEELLLTQWPGKPSRTSRPRESVGGQGKERRKSSRSKTPPPAESPGQTLPSSLSSLGALPAAPTELPPLKIAEPEQEVRNKVKPRRKSRSSTPPGGSPSKGTAKQLSPEQCAGSPPPLAESPGGQASTSKRCSKMATKHCEKGTEKSRFDWKEPEQTLEMDASKSEGFSPPSRAATKRQGKGLRRSTARGSVATQKGRSRLRTPPPSPGDTASDPAPRRAHEKTVNQIKPLNVYCRMRPVLDMDRYNQQDEEQGARVVIHDTLTVKMMGTSKLAHREAATFKFDVVFSPDRRCQKDVYDKCKDVVQGVIDGIDGNIFTYGQASSGKTFTMFGMGSADLDDSLWDDVEPDTLCKQSGIAQLAFKDVFRELERKTAGPDYFCVTGSVVELQMLDNGYCVCIDLLDDGSNAFEDCRKPRNNLTSAEGRVIHRHLTGHECRDATELMGLVEHGLERRRDCTGTLIIIAKVVSENEETLDRCKGKLVLCELAQPPPGAEITSSKACATQRELLALGEILRGLQQNPPIRAETHGVLPNLLSDELDAASRTVVLVHCSPFNDCEAETRRSLQYCSHVM